MNSALDVVQPGVPLCVAKLFKRAFDGHDLKPLRMQLAGQIQSGTVDPAVLMNLCVIDQLLGDQASGLKYQAQALASQCLYRSSWPVSSRALNVLAFMAPGDIGTNIPIDFLLEDTDVVIHMLYIVSGQPLPELPEHDIAIVAVSESDRNRLVLQEIERLIPAWPCPVLNSPSEIIKLSRERMYSSLQSAQGVRMPSTARVDRNSLEELGSGVKSIERLLDGGKFPLIARPIDSHAGRSLVKLEAPSSIADYLSQQQCAEFFISSFIDYRSSDGLFRKYRIIWIDGRAYPCHMAIADDWKVWYYNAGMATNAAKKDEEARFMTTFDADFVRRHSSALAEIAAHFKLEYFGIDCAELLDGRLLVFEGDIALVVHDMDPANLYPYKGAHTRKLFAAFREMLYRKSLSSRVPG